MKFNAPQHEDNDELLNITSMVDVVFILLAFFVLSTQFIDRERDVAMGMRPPATAGESESDLPEVITIRLTTDRSPVNGAADRVAIAMEQVQLPAGDYEAITARLSEINLPEISIVLAAEQQVSIEAVVKALDAILASPMRDISLAASPD